MYLVTLGYKDVGYHNLDDAVALYRLLNKGVEVTSDGYVPKEDGTPDYNKPLYVTGFVTCRLESKDVNVSEENTPF